MAIFGQPQATPFDEANQRTADQQNAFASIKDNLPALGLIAGLSMLARNNGTRSVGQLIGQAGGDALGAYSTWQKIEQAKQRQKMLDNIAAEERQYGRSQDAFRNDLALRKFGLEEQKMAQDMNIQRQRLAIAQANAALAHRNAMAGNWELVGNGMLMDKKTGTMRPLTDEEKAALQAGGGFGLGMPMTPAQEQLYKELAKGDADVFKAAQKQSSDAYSALANLDKLEQATSKIYMGKGGETIQDLRKIGAAFGITPKEDAAEGELFQQIAQGMAIQARNFLGGMPGALSDKDMARLDLTVPSIKNTPEGNRMIIDQYRKIYKRQQDVAKLYTDYVQRGQYVPGGFGTVLRKYAEEHPLFEEKKTRKPLSSFGG